jgi:hypothetical protein
LAVAVMMHGAYAQTTTGTGTGTAQAGASGGNVQFAPTTNSNSVVDYAANSAIAPGLVAGLKTCMGSSTAGFQVKEFGFATGSTWHDEDCQAGEFGQQLWNQGYKAAAIGVLCSRDVIRYAIAVTGGIPYRRSDGAVIHRACPMKESDWKAAGEPLLDPTTGQPYTEAELNPPAVAQAPAQPTAAQIEQAKAQIIEQHAKDAQAQAVESNVTLPDGRKAVPAIGAAVASK